MSSTITRFYTYLYFRLDGTPYYVGKGSKGRVTCRNNRFVPVPEQGRILVEYWVSEQEALEMEKWYINLYGRKDNGTGILRNLTDGGDGVSGYRHTEEANRRNSESHLGKPSPRRGSQHTAEANEKNRVAHLGRSAWNKGLSWPESVRKKMGRKGQPWSEARRAAQESRVSIRRAQ